VWATIHGGGRKKGIEVTRYNRQNSGVVITILNEIKNYIANVLAFILKFGSAKIRMGPS